MKRVRRLMPPREAYARKRECCLFLPIMRFIAKESQVA